MALAGVVIAEVERVSSPGGGRITDERLLFGSAGSAGRKKDRADWGEDKKEREKEA